MKAKSWLKYLGYILLVIAAVFSEGQMELVFQKDLTKNSKISYLLFTAYVLLTVVIGIVIGLEHILNEKKKEGDWKINVPKIVLMAIPSLYASLTYYFYFISAKNETVFNIMVNPIIKFFGKTDTFISIFQILLGYFIITSFYKGAKKNEVIVEASEFVEDGDTAENDEGMDPIENISEDNSLEISENEEK